MGKYDFYNALTHHGYLPVRVLGYNFVDWFLNVTPDFTEEFKYEVDANELKQGIRYNIQRTSIRDTAHINEQHQIELFENYNQFLWACSYSFLVIFDEGIHKPTLEGNYTGNFLDTSNPYINKALELFRAGLSLFESYREDVFYRLPNPEKYNDQDKFYIERASGIYTAAMTFILLHEFGHQYYGHVETPADDEQSKVDELLADEYAYDKMATHFDKEDGQTYKCGILIGLCSLAFSDGTLRGGNRHPDPDHRIVNLIEKMNLEETDNLWCIAVIALNMWAIAFGKQLSYSVIVDNYKELFYQTFAQLKFQKADLIR